MRRFLQTLAFGFVVSWPGLLSASELGASISDPAPLNVDASTDEYQDWAPLLALSAPDSWVAVWNRFSYATFTEEVMLSRSHDSGATWSAPQPLHPYSYSSVVALASSGNGTLGALLLTNGGVQWFAKSTDAGESWSEPSRLSSDGVLRDARLATDGSGTWIVAFSRTDSYNDYGILRSSDDGVTWQDPVYWLSVPDRAPAIATDGLGNWIVVLDENAYDRLRYVRSTDNGETWTEPQVTPFVSNDPYDFYPSVVVDSHGVWRVAWHSSFYGAAFSLCSATSTDSGVTWSEPICSLMGGLGEGPSGWFVSLVDARDHWVAVWNAGQDDDDRIVVFHSGDGGRSWSGPEHLGQSGGTTRPFTLATDGRGNWIAAWEGVDDLDGTIGSDTDILFSRWAFCEIRLSGRDVTEVHFFPDFPDPTFDVAVGSVSELREDRDFSAVQCLGQFSQTPATDPWLPPGPGAGYYYLARGTSGLCVPSGYGSSRGLDPDPREDLELSPPCP